MSPRHNVDHLRHPQIDAATAEMLHERGPLDRPIGEAGEPSIGKLTADPLVLRRQGRAARGDGGSE
jgi:hypothetical protein